MRLIIKLYILLIIGKWSDCLFSFWGKLVMDEVNNNDKYFL